MTLKEKYPEEWARWSPVRRKAEMALAKACVRAERRRDAAIEKAQQMIKDAEGRYQEEREKALRAYAEGEG